MKMRWLNGEQGRRVVILCASVVALGVALVIGLVSLGASRRPSASSAHQTALRSPSALFVSGNGNGGIILSWQPTHPAPVGYRIYRSTGRNGPYAIIGMVNAGDIDTFVDNAGLVPGVTYAYSVTAFNRKGESAPVGPVSVLVLPAPGATATVGLPNPLPTFVPVTDASLTAVARHMQKQPAPYSTAPPVVSTASPLSTPSIAAPIVSGSPVLGPMPSATAP